MQTRKDLIPLLVERFDLAAVRSTETDLPGVHLFFHDRCIARSPLLYHSGVIIVVSGRKRGHLDGRAFDYGDDRYLTLGLPLAMECETVASEAEPIFAIYIETDPSLVREIASQMEVPPAKKERQAPAVETARITPEFGDAVHRLMRLLCSAEDAAILGRNTVREIVYWALKGEAGDALRGLIHHDAHTARVAIVMQSLHENFAERHSVEDMARMAAMSPSVFHRAFRNVAGETPLRYLKKVRLTQASTLMIHDNYRVGAAATAVGYESAAQFSRDFKSHFGVNAVDARKLGYGFVRSRMSSGDAGGSRAPAE